MCHCCSQVLVYFSTQACLVESEIIETLRFCTRTGRYRTHGSSALTASGEHPRRAFAGACEDIVSEVGVSDVRGGILSLLASKEEQIDSLNERLHVAPFHSNKTCALCPPNLCKVRPPRRWAAWQQKPRATIVSRRRYVRAVDVAAVLMRPSWLLCPTFAAILEHGAQVERKPPHNT